MDLMGKIIIGIIGGGFVGTATRYLCENKKTKILVYDTSPEKSTVSSLEDLKNCELIFICVPTPMNPDGSCSTCIVETTVKEINRICPVAKIILRSTVPPGTSEKLKVDFMPEFLTERNWKRDVERCDRWILGLSPGTSDHSSILLQKILVEAHKESKITCKKIILETSKTAELTKYIANAFLATKISFFNEMGSICEHFEVPFENVRKLVTRDSRIGKSHSLVPGPDGKAGFGGVCLPKDISGLNFKF